MEDFRQNSLRECVHFTIDARQKRLVSRICAIRPKGIRGGKPDSRGPILDRSQWKKRLKKKREKRGWNKSTGVRLLHFRTGCFGGESAPKWYRKEFYMDSFKRNDQRKNKT